MEKCKADFSDVKHTNSKLKKNLSEKNEELLHWQRKGETSDKEVRALRLRIEQLKSELVLDHFRQPFFTLEHFRTMQGDAQDEIDNSSTTIKRLGRTKDELVGQVEGLQVQVEHLNSRLRSSVSTEHLFGFRRISRVSAPGGIADYKMAVRDDVIDDEETSTDENEFSYQEEVVHETDV